MITVFAISEFLTTLSLNEEHEYISQHKDEIRANSVLIPGCNFDMLIIYDFQHVVILRRGM